MPLLQSLTLRQRNMFHFLRERFTKKRRLFRGIDMTSSHSIPVDLSERLKTIQTQTYGLAEMIQILAIRAQVEELVVDKESLAFLGEIGQSTSLRHAIQLLSPANIVAKVNGRDNICKLIMKLDINGYQAFEMICLLRP